MKMIWLLALCVSLSAEVAEQPPRHVFGELNLPYNLTTPFHPRNVKHIIWKFVKNGRTTQIAKIENGVMIVNLGNRYKQFNNGTVLGIDNLTRNDLGRYIADVTYSDEDATMDEITIMLRVTESTPAVVDSSKQKKEHFPEKITISDLIHIITFVMVVSVAVIVAILVEKRTRLEKSSNTAEQANRKEDRRTHQNENVVKSHENNEPKNEENWTTPAQETYDQKEDRQTHQNKNVVKAHKNREHENEENLTTPVQETQTPASSVTVIPPDPSDKSPASSVIVIPPDPSDKYSKFQILWHRDYAAVDRQSCDVPTEKETDEEMTEHQHGQQEVIEMMPLMKTTEPTN